MDHLFPSVGRLATITLFATCLAAAASQSARADTVEKLDGSIIEGRVVAETPDAVTVESNSGGITLRQKIARARIRAVRKDVLEGPGYCTIPLIGEIGRDVLADDLNTAIAEARRTGAQYVILVIDSPGGLIAEEAKLLQVIGQNKDLKFVAHVKQAFSAAAALAISCPTICMSPDATIGAAVPFKVGPKGTPVEVEEKIRSAFSAMQRAAAGMGNHPDLWMRGMTEMDLELAVVRDASGPRVVEVTPTTTAPADATVIKKKGQILTLTAREALDGGLSTATVTSLAEIRAALQIPAWHDTGDAAASVMASRQLALKERARDEEELRDRVRERAAYLRKAAPTVNAANKGFDRALERVAAIDAEQSRLKTQLDADAAAVNAEYHTAIATANQNHDVAGAVRAKESARAKLAQLQAKYSAEIARLRTERDAALEQARKNLDKTRQTLTSAPPLE